MIELLRIGDVNGDGISDLAVGAPGMDNGVGALFVMFLTYDATSFGYNVSCVCVCVCVCVCGCCGHARATIETAFHSCRN